MVAYVDVIQQKRREINRLGVSMAQYVCGCLQNGYQEDNYLFRSVEFPNLELAEIGELAQNDLPRSGLRVGADVDCFKAVWGYTNVSTPQLDQFLFNGVRALLDVPDGTLMGLKFLLTSKRYRKKVLSFVNDPAIKDFLGGGL